MPKISVIMPCYNSEKYIREAIASILSQTYSDFELIIINDCSSDGSLQIIKDINDSRIRLINNEKNLGVAASLNRGLQEARGEFIARMDSDDIAYPERFAEQLAYFDKHPEIIVLGTAIELFGEGGDGRIICHPTKNDEIKAQLLFSNPICHPTVMMRSSVCDGGELYDNTYDKAEDLELWMRLSERYKFANLPHPLLHYRMHGNQVTKVFSSRQNEIMKELKRKQLQRLNIAATEDECSRIAELSSNHKASYYNEYIALLKKMYVSNNGYCGEREYRAAISQIFTKVISYCPMSVKESIKQLWKNGRYFKLPLKVTLSLYKNKVFIPLLKRSKK